MSCRRILGVVGLAATVEGAAGLETGEVDGDCPSLLQAKARHGVARVLTSDCPVVPPAAELTRMANTILEKFEGLDGGKPIYDTADKHYGSPPSWGYCTGIDYASANCLATEGSFVCESSSQAVRQQMAALGVDQCLDHAGGFAESETCKALSALFDTWSTLTKESPCGPTFKNYEVTDWGTTADPSVTKGWPSPRYNSWRTDGFEVTGNSSDGPTGQWNSLPAPWNVGNAANGFALCDIIRTVLQQNNNQVGTGTCGPSAVLGALNVRRPARALKFAAELFWTGTLTLFPQAANPCPYIYEQLPGMIPIVAATPDSQAECIRNGGNVPDCRNAAGQPRNPMGLEAMWVQALESAYTNLVHAQHMPEQEVCAAGQALKMNVASNSKEAAEAIHNAQSMPPAGLRWMCTTVLAEGSPCIWIMNTEICQGTMSDEDCTRLTALPDMTGTDVGFLEEVSKHTLTLQQAQEKSPLVKAFIQDVAQAAVAAGSQPLLAVQALFSFIQPAMTEQMLDTLCKANFAMFFVWSDPLNEAGMPQANRWQELDYQPRTPQLCDHWIFLESCDVETDTYTFFTWGYQVQMKRSFILGTPTANGHNDGLFCGGVYS